MSELAPVLDLRQPLPRLVAEDIAALLISGLTGRRLLAELQRRFGTASRFDLFLAIAMASADWEASLTLADAELSRHYRVTA